MLLSTDHTYAMKQEEDQQEIEIKYNPRDGEHTIVTMCREKDQCSVQSVVIIQKDRSRRNVDTKRTARTLSRSRSTRDRQLSPVKRHRAGALDRSRSMSRGNVQPLVRESSVSLRRRKQIVPGDDVGSVDLSIQTSRSWRSLRSRRSKLSASLSSSSTSSRHSRRSVFARARGILRRPKGQPAVYNQNDNVDEDSYHHGSNQFNRSLRSGRHHGGIPLTIRTKSAPSMSISLPHRGRWGMRRGNRRLPTTPEMEPI